MLAVALTLATLTAGPVQSVARDTAEPVLIEVALGRLASRTVASYRLGNAALLPVGQVGELAELRFETDGEQFIGTREPAGVRLVLDPAARRFRVGDQSRTLDPDRVLVRDGEIYLATDELGLLLDVEWVVNWADLTATALDPARLPIGLRVARDWKRRIDLARSESLDPTITLLPESRRTLDGLVVDYGVYAPSGRPLRDAAYSTALGLDLLGGSLTASVQSRDSDGRNRARTEFAWSGVWRDHPWLTHARIGDGITTGPRPRTVQGVVFGNAPYLRANDIGEVAFTGSLGPGWQVEAYRGGRLIAFDSANALGRYSIDAPIAYGENPVEFVAYGPFGEVRRFSRTHRVDANRLIAGNLEYGVAAGACRSAVCNASANADLRYGISTRWTVRAGFDQFWRPDSSGSLFHPYVGAFGTIGNAVGVEAELVANAVARASLRYEPSTNLVLVTEATRFARGVVQPILTPDGRTSQVTVSGLYRPDDRLAGWYLDGSIDHIRGERSVSTSGRLGGSLQLRQLQLLPAIRWQRTTGSALTSSRTTLEVNSYLLPLPQLGPVLGRMTARSYVEMDLARGIAATNLFVSRNLDRNVRVELGGGWSRFQGHALAVNVAANLQTIRGLFTVSRSGGQTTATQYVQGSVLYDPAGGKLRLSAGPSVERAGVTGRVFLDDNGNERFDDGEQLLPNVRVAVGLETRVSNEQGEYHLWNVSPWQPAVVAVDSATLASPLWVPARGAVAVEPGPNRYRVVDIPIAPGGVIDGTVFRAADSTGVAGVSLVLRHLATGEERTITSFSDGEFYAMGIRPGEYELLVGERTAARLGVTAPPIRFRIEASAEGGSVSGLRIGLR